MESNIHKALGLTDDENKLIHDILDRSPNYLELAMFSVMWSEHCSYKSSRIHLRRLPTKGERVLVGPGENAGVIDAGGGVAIAIRIESHNHPSAIEPFQGAATGVGGIIRDIFSVGARPIALLDSLKFGPLDDPRNRWIFEGVVSGISSYGNSVGVPTVGGELDFSSCYSDNPLVNVACLGVMPKSRLVLAQATGVGNLVVLFGSLTGRDGIGGVSVLASAGFKKSNSKDALSNAEKNLARTNDEDDKRSSVQVGDPFEEKILIEACLELQQAGLVVGIQDLGGAGLSSALSETASRGGVGMDINVNAVPLREPGMAPYEILTSESQERMLAIVTPQDLEQVLAVCKKWGIEAAVIAKVVQGDSLRVLDGWDGQILADIPASFLHDASPVCERPLKEPENFQLIKSDNAKFDKPLDCAKDLLALLQDPSWVYKQYDRHLFLNTVSEDGSDAAVLLLKAPGLDIQEKDLIGTKDNFSKKADAIALSADSNPRWVSLDPYKGTALIVAESVLNLACAGAEAVALVNCLNYGNPEHPEVMWQFSESIDGMAHACKSFNLPVVGGNVSFYNESGGKDIDPSPVVTTLGLIDKLNKRPPSPRLFPNAQILLIGPESENLAGSAWADVIHRYRGGSLAELDVQMHQKVVSGVIELLKADLVLGIHDISQGGLGVALVEMAIRSKIGFVVDGINYKELFSEAPSRVIICTNKAEEILSYCQDNSIPAKTLGIAKGTDLIIKDLVKLELGQASAQIGLPKEFIPTQV